ncbi:50S ribosomal protein L3 [Clostridium thermosuccinogenes]|uniref:Large ribosomal subunit protein uL3 n=1 Tax=Clostridium thermosuccinogenes TaxID=84032 RepID=A0A2K2FCP1_9CLOT|nr:50S ribosomal protein L3 [Pseudoclostridium thermosuccinogenes]AUS98146.1 50S ribosomal protein L3 [Pseudoclostridium thermosuccinogenes]PNT91199.1 50S ribosomal protein L3 [Pseudoclostridium thermosuccinogenes]PNT95383.1 50S ribosomal protein L3 [Pseudoclostridium thermosuccinogenes]PNT96559.1 50S ribosomal protein L3 [Pseudoclostridium thermosuccinogenes]
MKKFILGKKVGMTQIFNENGIALPVTVIEAGPITVVQRKTTESDGYSAVRVGFEGVSEKKLNKPDKGIFSKTKISPLRYLKEFRVDDSDNFEVGQEIKVADMFQIGEKVDVSGISKGKGFQSTIKRFGQSGGRETHGSMYHRRPGSMGPNTSPGRVFKGKKLPGHMGAERVTVQNLEVVKVDSERNLLVVKGAVPGPKGGLLEIKETVKSGK